MGRLHRGMTLLAALVLAGDCAPRVQAPSPLSIAVPLSIDSAEPSRDVDVLARLDELLAASLATTRAIENALSRFAESRPRREQDLPVTHDK